MNLFPINFLPRLARVCFCLGMILLLAGCTSPRLERKAADIPIGSRYKPANLFTVPQLPENFRRVAVLPLHIPGEVEVDVDEMSTILTSELRRTRRFEIVEISPETLINLIGVSRLSTLGTFPPELVEYLKTRIDADGVLQNDLTTYRPYRPFEIGLRSRLFDLESHSPLWAVDEVLNAGSKDVHNGLRHYSLGEYYAKYPYGDSYSALRSPSRFVAYAAYTLYKTIPGFELNNSISPD